MELLEHIRRGISTYLPALLLALAVTLFCTAGSTVFATGEGADPAALQEAAKAVSPAGAAQEDHADQGDQADTKEESGTDSLDAGQEADPPGEDSGSTGSETPEGLFPPEGLRKRDVPPRRRNVPFHVKLAGWRRR